MPYTTFLDNGTGTSQYDANMDAIGALVYNCVALKFGTDVSNLATITKEQRVIGFEEEPKGLMGFVAKKASDACLTKDGSFSFNAIFTELLMRLNGKAGDSAKFIGNVGALNAPKHSAKYVISPNTLTEIDLRLKRDPNGGPVFKPEIAFNFVVPSYVEAVGRDKSSGGLVLGPKTDLWSLTIHVNSLPLVRTQDTGAFIQNYFKFALSKSKYTFHNLCFARVSFYSKDTPSSKEKCLRVVQMAEKIYRNGQPTYAVPFVVASVHSTTTKAVNSVGGLCGVPQDKMSWAIDTMKKAFKVHNATKLPCMWIDPNTYIADSMLCEQTLQYPTLSDGGKTFIRTCDRYANMDYDHIIRTQPNSADPVKELSAAYGMPVASVLFEDI